jgi:hypothetical protein
VDDVAVAERRALTVQVSHLFIVREDVHVLAHLAVFVAQTLGKARVSSDEPRERARDVGRFDRRAARASGEFAEGAVELHRYVPHAHWQSRQGAA